MKLSVTQAKAQLTELVRLAEAGEEVVLTRFGRDVVRLVPMATRLPPGERRVFLEAIAKEGRRKAKPGPSAARSQDFLYDEATGLPT